MSVPKLPVPVSIFRQARKVTALCARNPLDAGLKLDDLAIRRRNNAEVFCQRVQPQIIPPTQFDVLELACDPRNCLSRRLPVLKDELPIHR